MLFLDAEIASGVLDGFMTEENLSHAEVGSLPVDVGDTGTSQGMRAVDGRIKAGEGDPLLHQAAVSIHAEALAGRAVL